MNELKEQRLNKLKELSDLGIRPFGGRFDRKDTAQRTAPKVECLASTPILGRYRILRRSRG